MTIKILTINAKGLNHPAKRSSLWKLAEESTCDILCVQETHFQASNPPRCTHKNFNTTFSACASTKKKGVLVAIKNMLTFQLHTCTTDQDGRYIILVCSINDAVYTIVTVYTPNTQQLRFLRKLHKKVSTVQQGATIWCGDFNITPDPILDSSSSSIRYKPSLGPLLPVFQLYDVWRCQQAEERDYTFSHPVIIPTLASISSFSTNGLYRKYWHPPPYPLHGLTTHP